MDNFTYLHSTHMVRAQLESAPSSSSSGPGLGEATPPAKVVDVEHDIEREARRWRAGVRVAEH
jgi:hypothetical protein